MTMLHLRDALLVALAAAAAAALAAPRSAAGETPRIGWEENFDDISRWETALKNPGHGTPVLSVTGVGGMIEIVTQCGALNPDSKFPNWAKHPAEWPRWPDKPASSFTNFGVRYQGAVDVDTYRYLVIRIPEKSGFFYLAFAGKQVKGCYTTGIHAEDLKASGLAGKQDISFYGQFLNTSGRVKIDYIRLVSELTPEEKAGLVGSGITIRDEKMTGHPYHNLEALNARAGRAGRADPVGGELCVYRDAGTGAEVWRMTASPADENGVAFNCDGSAFSLKGRSGSGFHVFDWTTGKFTLVEGGLGDAAPRFSTTDPDMIVMAENKWLEKPLRRLSINYLNFRKGEKTEVAAFETSAPWIVQELDSSPDSSKLAFGFRETPIVFLIDPDEKDPAKRCREITLPTRLKGVGLINKDRELGWHNCYTYEPWIMDLATGQVTHGNSCCAGGHSAGGPYVTVGPYSDSMKLLVKNGLHHQTEATADDVKLFAVYKNPFPTDYGHITRDSKWVVTDGCGGDIDKQHLMISTADPATVLHLCFYSTSRNDWVTNTYSWSSPDATKIAWVSDQFGDGDICMVVTGLPKPPTALAAKRAAGSVELSWNAPAGVKEVAGYRIYRSAKSGSGFTPLNSEPVKGITFSDAGAPKGALFYLVAMVEPSGLEGHFSSEAAVDADAKTARTVFIEAENCLFKPPFREVLRGEASGSRYIRIHHATPEEPASGTACFVDPPPVQGKYSIWIRARAEGEPGELLVKVVDSATVKVAKGNGSFTWFKAEGTISGVDLMRQGSMVAPAISASTDGLSIDKIAFSSDPAFDPTKLGSAGPVTEPPAPAKELAASDVKPQSLVLRWTASPAKNLVRYDVHCGGTEDPASLGNATIIGSTKGTELADWGLKPGTEYVYRVVAVDSRGNRSAPVTLKVKTADEPVQLLTCDAASAEKDARVTVTKDADTGESFAVLPDPGAERDKAAPAKVTFAVDVERDGEFMLWVLYRPGYTGAGLMKYGLEIDGQPAGDWRIRSPYRPMWGTLRSVTAGAPRVFADKVVAGGKDVFALTKGKHTVTLVLDPKAGENPHAVARVWATNDHSWRPKQFDPRANFAKSSKKEE